MLTLDIDAPFEATESGKQFGGTGTIVDFRAAAVSGRVVIPLLVGCKVVAVDVLSVCLIIAIDSFMNVGTDV